MNTYQAELYHHGIKGQRWGVRRYQNPDGSLTEAGKKKYDKTMARFDKRLKPVVQKVVGLKKGIRETKKELTDVKNNGYNSKTFKKSFEDYYDEKAEKAGKDFLERHMDWLVDSLTEGIEMDSHELNIWMNHEMTILADRTRALNKQGLLAKKG